MVSWTTTCPDLCHGIIVYTVNWHENREIQMVLNPNSPCCLHIEKNVQKAMKSKSKSDLSQAILSLTKIFHGSFLKVVDPTSWVTPWCPTFQPLGSPVSPVPPGDTAAHRRSRRASERSSAPKVSATVSTQRRMSLQKLNANCRSSTASPLGIERSLRL